jgi:hypothetical protein
MNRDFWNIFAWVLGLIPGRIPKRIILFPNGVSKSSKGGQLSKKIC